MSDDRDHDENQCLHCFLQAAIETWAEDTGHTDAEHAVIADAVDIAAGIGQLVADLMAQSPDDSTAREFMREVMSSAARAYPLYREHYSNAQVLERHEPRGKPN